MSLILRVASGDKLSIGDKMSLVEPASVRLVTAGGKVIDLSEDEVAIAPHVTARSGQSSVLAGFAMVFTAPKDVSILCIRGALGR